MLDQLSGAEQFETSVGDGGVARQSACATRREIGARTVGGAVCLLRVKLPGSATNIGDHWGVCGAAGLKGCTYLVTSHTAARHTRRELLHIQHDTSHHLSHTIVLTSLCTVRWGVLQFTSNDLAHCHDLQRCTTPRPGFVAAVLCPYACGTGSIIARSHPHTPPRPLITTHCGGPLPRRPRLKRVRS